MTTITLKIDKNTKAGKAFMAMSEAFLQNVEGIEIIENDSDIEKKSEVTVDNVQEEKSLYSAEFISKIKKAELNIKKEKTTRLNPKDIWGSIL